MTCSRARAALKCENAVVKELCAASCLACHEDVHPDALEAADLDTIYYQYNALVIANERRQTLWQCAKDREAANYDCDTLSMRCPMY
eukprot:m.296357 g.296357  ORF g.296357 m.296357 type:complete len:87 (+) comp68488_c0_seq1:319-579(+)